jgi:predicted P-loop ATPase
MSIKIVPKSKSQNNIIIDKKVDKPSDDKPGNVVIMHADTKPINEPDWIGLCQREAGKPINNIANVLIALRHDPALSAAIAFNEMLQRAYLLKLPLNQKKSQNFTQRAVTDQDVTFLQEYLQLCGLNNIGKHAVHDAVDARARECSFHPVRENLSELQWDGTERVDSWLSTYLGAEKTPYTQGIGRMFIISMVARVFEPGCKCDYMLVLEGAQGTRKSTACAILGGQWFSDSLPDITGGKDVAQHLPGKWLIEIAEMSAMTRAESNHLKAFMTRRVEQYRPSFGRKEVKEPRQCVLVGTTNKSIYLKDETGGRRFWPLRTGKIHTDMLQKDRDQLFAEAVKLYHEGALWHPDAEFERQHILPEQDARFETDPWEEPICDYIKMFNPKHLYIASLCEKALEISVPNRGRAIANRIVAILERIGWQRLKKDAKGNVPWGPSIKWSTDNPDNPDKISLNPPSKNPLPKDYDL